ncbi:MAG: type IV pili methyl-accepting chemotaxis transducer N-terminal domain-containing protein [Polaromonas sp.]|uniref:ANTAR domain-containing protein n=1 Tax=Polaromonas sp. TaxID=1869339 RepID=UPI0027345BEC|nr:ANTAR domain-containing protein [Polaromonas sp.]MDP1953909.1 type IV pili methyl-accepting chemotaxis transducer N-terminal domain-containing protein [Polaromonas sp.]MDP3354932.1 type IV pili methyl-accepting chemotaxis transducer N-terminal domain-containing protein [Polaromonas sp.]MDP3797202.1 type IV pili methyl-accepting chemotaxis transducer N-terminal domain-containing protein [Polaromonas sp.]
MTSALVILNGPSSPHALAADLEAVGIEVLGTLQGCSKLVQEVLRQSPDVVICDDPVPGEEIFKALGLVGETSPRPLIVFSTDADAGRIARAVQAGVHAYVVNGYARQRLRPLIHLAQARFSREQALREEMRDVASRLEERKVVDRAKGILMRAREVSDDDAFKMLRTASMHSNQRLGQVSEHIIHSARFAEDVNRSGQLRMLSQRLVKLALLQLGGTLPAQVPVWLKDSVMRIDANLAALGKNLSQPTFGDLLAQIQRTWSQLKPMLQGATAAGPMSQLDALAGQLLQQAESLTGSLESAGAMPPLQVLNLAGRQRMLSQRFAKYALVGMLGARAGMAPDAQGLAQTRIAFDEALGYLNTIPLSSKEIRALLDTAAVSWAQMLAGTAPGAADLERVATASEDLLDVFDKLSVHYGRSMQMLVG